MICAQIWASSSNTRSIRLVSRCCNIEVTAIPEATSPVATRISVAATRRTRRGSLPRRCLAIAAFSSGCRSD
ncbi:Uncharacterised protein [Mycobacterium tuberculosis]|nr:Uncharacterised protein [Mycobacterium tuberculosis]